MDQPLDTGGYLFYTCLQNITICSFHPNVYVCKSLPLSLFVCITNIQFPLFSSFFSLSLPDEGKKLHFVSPARRKSVLAPILNKIKNGTDANGGSSTGGGSGGNSGSGNGSDNEKKSNGTDSTGHISVQIEPAKKVKVSF